LHFFSDGVGEKVGFVYIGTNKANMKLKNIGCWLLMLIFLPQLKAQSDAYQLRGSVFGCNISAAFDRSPMSAFLKIPTCMRSPM
jgi:hypothetical protein